MHGPLANRPFHLEGSSDHAVLFVHGLGGGPYELQRLAEALSRREALTMIGIHLPGHDAPGSRMPASTWTEWYATLAETYADLLTRFARVDLVGFSLGGALVLHLAANTEIVGRVAVLAPFLGIFQPPLLPMPTEVLVHGLPFVRVVPSRRPPIRDAETRHEVASVVPFRQFNLDATRSALALIEIVTAELDRIVAPTLIVQGRRDTVVDVRRTAAMYARLSTEKRLVWLDDSDHQVTFDRDASQVIDAVAAHLLGPGET